MLCCCVRPHLSRTLHVHHHVPQVKHVAHVCEEALGGNVGVHVVLRGGAGVCVGGGGGGVWRGGGGGGEGEGVLTHVVWEAAVEQGT